MTRYRWEQLAKALALGTRRASLPLARADVAWRFAR
jgi:hypothetical protein